MDVEIPVRLTALASCGGCASKLGSAELRIGAGALAVDHQRPRFGRFRHRRRRRRAMHFATILRSCKPSTSLRRSSTIRTISAASPRPMRSPTSMRWAARRSARSTSSAFPESLDLAILARILEGGADVARAAGRRDPRRPHDQGRRAEVRHGRDRHHRSAPHRHQRGREARRRARAHQADRHRHPYDGGQARRDLAMRVGIRRSAG